MTRASPLRALGSGHGAPPAVPPCSAPSEAAPHARGSRARLPPRRSSPFPGAAHRAGAEQRGGAFPLLPAGPGRGHGGAATAAAARGRAGGAGGAGAPRRPPAVPPPRLWGGGGAAGHGLQPGAGPAAPGAAAPARPRAAGGGGGAAAAAGAERRGRPGAAGAEPGAAAAAHGAAAGARRGAAAPGAGRRSGPGPLTLCPQVGARPADPVPAGRLERALSRCPQLFAVPRKRLAAAVRLLRERCLFTAEQLREVLSSCPAVLLEEPCSLHHHFQYAYFRMGVRQKEMVKARLFQMPFAELRNRHIFLERRGLYETPHKGQIQTNNPKLKDILQLSEKDFLASLACSTLEEYEVFKKLLAREEAEEGKEEEVDALYAEEDDDLDSERSKTAPE
ncbi:transcription termination factor 4, mitochondrial isoform X1 [Pseudopipra pipra]|uniref:transcription termination factor 4, mitochondrial isoform X1 n=1 Tax=Pseudopipra pipra TaxID=415032 RepID=UPI00313A2CA9